MQLITDMQKRAEEFIRENGPTLLTAGGVVGTVATAVLAWRGGTKYSELLGDQVEARMLVASRENQDMEPITRIEKIQMAVPYLAPPVVTGTTTVAAIIMANRMSAQKAAALAALYGLAEGRLTEYKEKVAEKIGPTKDQKIKDELAQESVAKTPGSGSIVVVEGEVLCFDRPTGRYFRSTMENIKKAVNATNAEILHADHARATFFYEELNLPGTTWTDEVGWNTDQLVDLDYSTVLAEDDRPCIAIDFKTLPKLDYLPKHY